MKTVPIPIYGGRLIVVKTQEEFDRVYMRQLAKGCQLRDEDTGAHSLGGQTSAAVIDDQLVIVSGVFDRLGRTRCHEATHCAQYVADKAGMNPIRESEAFAYLTEWFYVELAS